MVTSAQIVRKYLTAFTSGQTETALALLKDDFSFRTPTMQRTADKKAFADILSHGAEVARGLRMLRQWEDGHEVCTLYELEVEAPSGPATILICEWDTVQAGGIASSLLVFDTGALPTTAAGASPTVDPVCGMAVDPGRGHPARPRGTRLSLLQPHLRRALRPGSEPLRLTTDGPWQNSVRSHRILLASGVPPPSGAVCNVPSPATAPNLGI